MTEVSDERKPHEYALPVSFAFWFHMSPSPLVETNAQISIAIQAIGTMMLFAMNNQRRLLGCMHKNGRLINQKRKKLIIVAVSMPWETGMPFFSVKKLGQIAPIMTLTEFAPFIFWMANQKTARMARETMAM
jgi:hypothetical protein